MMVNLHIAYIRPKRQLSDFFSSCFFIVLVINETRSARYDQLIQVYDTIKETGRLDYREVFETEYPLYEYFRLYSTYYTRRSMNSIYLQLEKPKNPMVSAT